MWKDSSKTTVRHRNVHPNDQYVARSALLRHDTLLWKDSFTELTQPTAVPCMSDDDAPRRAALRCIRCTSQPRASFVQLWGHLHFMTTFQQASQPSISHLCTPFYSNFLCSQNNTSSSSNTDIQISHIGTHNNDLSIPLSLSHISPTKHPPSSGTSDTTTTYPHNNQLITITTNNQYLQLLTVRSKL